MKEKYNSGKAINFEAFTPKIRDILVDLAYRGDFRDSTMKIFMPAAMKNSELELAEALESE